MIPVMPQNAIARFGASPLPMLPARPALAGPTSLSLPARVPQGAPNFAMPARPQMPIQQQPGMFMPPAAPNMPVNMQARPQMPSAPQNALSQRLGMAY